MSEPIERMLNTPQQIAWARLEDSVVKAIYEIDSGIVMHGGTAIWRCYGGYRFSSDIDMYVTDLQIKKFNLELTWKLSKYQAKHEVSSHDGRIIKIFNDSAKTKLECMKPPGHLNSIPALYEMVNGTKTTIKTLSVDNFIKEKIDAYEKRMYARDLFDIYQLTINHDISKDSKRILSKFIKTVEKPKDQDILKDIVYVGAAPTFNEMIDAISGKLK